jgi:hypothetical protein
LSEKTGLDNWTGPPVALTVIVPQLIGAPPTVKEPHASAV